MVKKTATNKTAVKAAKTSTETNEKQFTPREDAFLKRLAEATVRAGLASRLGKSYQGDRDIYQELGYPEQIRLDDYFAKYRRHPVAKRVVNAPVRKCWRDKPTIAEIGDSDDGRSVFEAAWEDVVKRRRVFHYFSRVDRLARVAEYAILVLGFDDGKAFNQELTSARELMYMTPYPQTAVDVIEYEDDVKNERYGRPRLYRVKPNDVSGASFVGVSSGAPLIVHYSRVIHVAEDPLEDDNIGTPELEACYNDLMNIELVAGSSAEMYWRGAFPGMALLTAEGGWPQTQTEDDIQDEVDKYYHRFKRILRLTGIDVKELAQQISDPTGQVKIYLMMISCATGIPIRILMGSERGELSSDQDERNWAEQVDARRREHCEPVILRPSIDAMIAAGVLPEPRDGYVVNWPDIFAPSDDQKADIGVKRARALKDYVDSLGAEQLVPPEMALKTLLGLSKDEIEEIMTIRDSEVDEEGDPGEGGPDTEEL